ncbi:MAG: TerB family tellurite resistance protein [Myxococcales bacterium]|nr:TerB family tellurite resistance protein [Myxococcales bacterium]
MYTPDVPLRAGLTYGLSPATLRWGLGAVRHVVAPAGPWPTQAGRLADAVLWKAEITLDPRSIEPISPSAAALALPQPELRVQLVRLAIMAAMVDGRPDEATVRRVEQLAAALDVDSPALLDLRYLSQGRHLRLWLHLMPRFWVADALRRHVRAHGWWSVVRMIGVTLRLWSDRRVTARFEAFDDRPNTLGKRLLEFLRGASIPLPGHRGAAPYLVAYHDLSHVLAGYATDPRSEVQAACFQAGYRQADPFTLVFFVLCQFHLGLRMTPAAKAEVGCFDPFRAIDALYRGAAMNRDLTDGTWDFWAYLGEDVDDLRRRYHVVPPASPPRPTSQAA